MCGVYKLIYIYVVEWNSRYKDFFNILFFLGNVVGIYGKVWYV